MKISNLEENASQSVFAREIFYQLSLQRPEATYYWILGEDQLNQLPYWNRIDDYASQLEWVALSRDRDHHLGVSGPRSRRLISSTCRYFWAVIERRMAISSTEIRENLLNKSGDIPSEIRADVIDFYKNLKIKE
jgi:nicotinic acid mononucleotide adenylyltransferase